MKSEIIECPNCGHPFNKHIPYNFCPNCTLLQNISLIIRKMKIEKIKNNLDNK